MGWWCHLKCVEAVVPEGRFQLPEVRRAPNRGEWRRGEDRVSTLPSSSVFSPADALTRWAGEVTKQTWYIFVCADRPWLQVPAGQSVATAYDNLSSPAGLQPTSARWHHGGAFIRRCLIRCRSICLRLATGRIRQWALPVHFSPRPNPKRRRGGQSPQPRLPSLPPAVSSGCPRLSTVRMKSPWQRQASGDRDVTTAGPSARALGRACRSSTRFGDRCQLASRPCRGYRCSSAGFASPGRPTTFGLSPFVFVPARSPPRCAPHLAVRRNAPPSPCSWTAFLTYWLSLSTSAADPPTTTVRSWQAGSFSQQSVHLRPFAVRRASPPHAFSVPSPPLSIP